MPIRPLSYQFVWCWMLGYGDCVSPMLLVLSLYHSTWDKTILPDVFTRPKLAYRTKKSIFNPPDKSVDTPPSSINANCSVVPPLWYAFMFSTVDNVPSGIVGSYKSAVSRHAHRLGCDFAWQSRFYDAIIRDNRALIRVQSYIGNNPKNWKEDKFCERWLNQPLYRKQGIWIFPFMMIVILFEIPQKSCIFAALFW